MLIKLVIFFLIKNFNNQYIYIKPKPLLAPQFSTLAQYLKNKNYNSSKP